MKITLVPPENVFEVWSDIREYLEPAVETSNGRSQLWIAFDEERIWGALTTEITQYPGKRCLSMHFLGGTSLEQWYPSMLEHVTNHGKNMNCSAIEGTARFGFWKFLKQDGFDKTSAFYEKDL